MGRGWNIAKTVLGLHMCNWVPTEEEDNHVDDLGSPTPKSEGNTTKSLSSSVRSLRLSKSACAICLETMKPGSGHALFTAECSHTFHFPCIASNVKHGNLVCPVCRAKWKEVPWQAPTRHENGNSRLRTSRSSLSGSSGNQLEAVIRGQDPRFHRAYSFPAQINQEVVNSEPLVFDDDEALPLAHQTMSGGQNSEADTVLEVGRPQTHVEGATMEIPRGSPKGKGEKGLSADVGTPEMSCTSKLEIKTFAEFQSVPYSDSFESFPVLVHIKAPLLTRGNSSIGGTESIRNNTAENSRDQHRPISNSNSASEEASFILDPSRRAPIDLVAILDVSGSMAGNKLVLLKRAMAFVICNLSASDRLSVVVFSSTARRLFPLKCMNEEGRRLSLRAIDALVSIGGTNISEGLRKGAKVLDDRQHRNPVASIMLLSDGQDTHCASSTQTQSFSPSSQDRISQGEQSASVQQGMRYGHVSIPVHTFGFGADHDAATMHSISEVSGGTFSFIQAEGVVQDAFAQCVGGILSVVVQDVELVISSGMHGTQVKGIHAGSYTSTISDDGQRGVVKLGDLYADEERDILLDLKLPALSAVPEKKNQMMVAIQVGCRYRDPVTHETRHTQLHELILYRPKFVDANQPISLEVDRQKNRLLTANVISEVGLLADKGDFTGAQQLIDTTIHKIRLSVSHQDGDNLSEALEAELAEIKERLGNRQVYERSGRAYILSAQSSHFCQRATTRGQSVERHKRDYQTPSMVGMILRSQTQSESRTFAENANARTINRVRSLSKSIPGRTQR